MWEPWILPSDQWLLSMPLTERRQRQEQNYRVLMHNDITHWAERFLAKLEPAVETDDSPPARVAGGRG